jgi:predicted Zn-ribbon and HTH transcriptional regulator
MHYWLVTALFAIAPAARLIKAVRRRRRFAAGHCPTCGYDLRATPNRCPECGAGGVSAAAGAVPAAQ